MVLVLFLPCGQVPVDAGKLSQHLHKACQQGEALSAPVLHTDALTLDWMKQLVPTQAEDMAPQRNVDYLPVPCSFKLLDFRVNGKIYFHLKYNFWDFEHILKQFSHLLLSLAYE